MQREKKKTAQERERENVGRATMREGEKKEKSTCDTITTAMGRSRK